MGYAPSALTHPTRYALDFIALSLLRAQLVQRPIIFDDHERPCLRVGENEIAVAASIEVELAVCEAGVPFLNYIRQARFGEHPQPVVGRDILKFAEDAFLRPVEEGR